VQRVTGKLSEVEDAMRQIFHLAGNGSSKVGKVRKAEDDHLKALRPDDRAESDFTTEDRVSVSLPRTILFQKGIMVLGVGPMI